MTNDIGRADKIYSAVCPNAQSPLLTSRLNQTSEISPAIIWEKIRRDLEKLLRRYPDEPALETLEQN